MDRGGVRNSRKRTSPRSREKLSARATETGLSSHMGWDTLPLTGTRVLRSGFPLSPDPGAGLLTRRCELSLWACLRPRGTETKQVKVIYKARRTYSTYVFIGNRSDYEGRSRVPTSAPGSCEEGREEESAFTQRLLLSPACLGGPFRCSQQAQERPWGAAGGKGRLLTLDRDLSRPSDMRGAPGGLS